MGSPAQIFDDVDESGDGLLDKEEIKHVFNSKGVVLSTVELDQVYDDMDEDGSGEVDGQRLKCPHVNDEHFVKKTYHLLLSARLLSHRTGH